MFDFDGVVADSEAEFHAVLVDVCKDMELPTLASRDAFREVFDTNMIEGLRLAGFPEERIDALLARLGPRLAEANRRVEAFPGMPELLNDLASRCPVFVITSNLSAVIQAFLERYRIEGIRDVLGVDREASKVKKIRGVIEDYPVHAPHYVGDTRGDMVEARVAGAVAVAVTWGWHDTARVQSGNPDHVAESPAALRALFLGEGE